MALLNCPDCGKQVSDAAPSCPGCGRPIAGTSTAPTKVEISGQVKTTGGGALIKGIGFLAILVGMFTGIVGMTNHSAGMMLGGFAAGFVGFIVFVVGRFLD